MLSENPCLYLRVLWLTHWYATGERSMPLPTSHGPSQRERIGP